MGARIVKHPSKRNQGYREVLVIGLPKDDGRKLELPADIVGRFAKDGKLTGRRVG